MSPHPMFTLPISPGFNPRALPDLTPPVFGVKTWQWLADRANDGEEKSAYIKRFDGGFGSPDPGHRRPIGVPVPEADVIASHLTQDVVLDLAGAPPVRLNLGPATEEESTGPFPFDFPVAVYGTLPPLSVFERSYGMRLPEDLQLYLANHRMRSQTATAFADDRRWVETVVLADATDADTAWLAARIYLQPFYSVWRPEGGRTVIEVRESDRGELVTQGFGRVGRLTARTCPLLPGSGRGDLCRMHGGPWISASIHAAAWWRRKRARAVEAVGCDTCGDASIKIFPFGRITGGGGTVSVGPGPQWQSRHLQLERPDES